MISPKLRAAFACALDPCSAVVRDCATYNGQDSLPASITSRYGVAGEDDYNELVEVAGFEAAEEFPARSSRRRSTNEEFAKLAKIFGFKRCPSCGNACIKEDGDSCDHMTCLCGKEFCWTCLADRDVILHHGNHYHKRHCRFFVAYDGPAEFVSKCSACKKRGKACMPP